MQPKRLRHDYRLTIDLFIYPKPFRDLRLIDEARYSLDIPNAGGSSDVSEALSMQYMHDKFGASDFIPEMDVPYWIDAKKCDYLMKIKGEYIGVSVTRAISYPFELDYTMEKARDLISRKLYGLIVARSCTSDGYEFAESILHVWCYNAKVASLIEAAHDAIVAEDKGQETYDQVHVICTICTYGYVYTNRP